MQPLLGIVMVLAFAWSTFKFVAVRGGSSWFWASLSVAGYLIVELTVCYAVKASPRDYFFNWFPAGGIVWLLLVALVARFRFRGAMRINP
jgi:hypothetical protein